MKALMRDKTKRYQTVAALQQDIAAYQGGFATSAEGASAMRLLLLLIRRHRTEFLLTLISVTLMVGLATHFTRKITHTLAELRETAPSFYFEAKTLVDDLKFAKALAKINYAISLQPENAQFHTLKGNILQSMLQLADARDSYARALELDPNHEMPYVEFNLNLCERLLANSTNGIISPQGLNDLRVSMTHQLRTAEALALATRDSPDAKTAFESWRAVVNKIGLQGALRRESGGLALSVQQPDFNDLSPFRNAPLTKLLIANTQVDDLAPAKNMPLVLLDISGTRVTDLRVLKDMPLTRLDAARIRATNFNALAGLKLTSLNLAHTGISNLSPLKQAPLRFLQLEGCTNLTDFSALAEFKSLEGITLPVGVRNLDSIRQLPRLKHIGYSLPEGGWAQVPKAEDFWRLQSPPPGGK
ncbi:MAG: hypothetical protein EBY09_19350 [Verrucomicrobia bacterium]|nr:hypothetical protein [Verrucomicrobiota bacterium]NDF00800.1 hypothetical protein [Verrucomicrobiota bacterium]